MPNIKEQRRDEIAAARQLFDNAKAANRNLTAGERATFDAHVAKADELAAHIQGAEVDEERMRRMTALAPVPYGSGAKAIDLFDETQRAGIVSAVKSRTAYRAEINSKAMSNTVLPTAGTAAVAGLFPTAYPLAALFGNEQAEGPSQRYYTFGGATAAVVAEFGTKPDSGLTITPKDVVLQKIATTVRFSDEFADHAPFLLSYLSGELISAVSVKENSEILATFAATSGIATATGAAADALDVYADAIGTAEAINGVTPSALLTHPGDLAAVRKAKGTTGGAYFVDPLAAVLRLFTACR